MFNRVVLPLPFGPIRPWTSPGRSAIDTPDSAATPPKCLHRPRTDSAPVAVCGVMAPAPAATWRRSTVADRAPPAAPGGGRGGAPPTRPARCRRPWGWAAPPPPPPLHPAEGEPRQFQPQRRDADRRSRHVAVAQGDQTTAPHATADVPGQPSDGQA